MRHRWLAILAVLLLIPSQPLHAARLLIVAPHPDDDIIIAAGIAASALQRGDTVKVVYMTNGDALGLEQGYIRQAESVAAQTQYVGTREQDLIFLGYPDAGLRTIYDDYTEADDAFTSRAGQNQTYGSRGLGGSDYHRHQFGTAALYNSVNVLNDLKSIIANYRPDHILTASEADQHLDHSTTYRFVRQAMEEVMAQTADYRPTLHKTLVWDRENSHYPVWPPEIPDPGADHTKPPGLGRSRLIWEERESFDVPLAMQQTALPQNPKHQALDAHASQGGAASFIGRFVRKDEFFWVDKTGEITAPHVDAGFGQVVAPGSAVQLNGGRSHNPGGGGLSYHWRQIAGTPVTLSDANAINPGFIAPLYARPDEVLVFTLVVDNGLQSSLPDSVSIYLTDPGDNIAPSASVSASSENSASGQSARKAIDGVADGYPGDHSREWASRGEGAGAWIELRWSAPRRINKVILFDRPNPADWISEGLLTFSDGSRVAVGALHDNGAPTTIHFSPRNATSVRFTALAVGAGTLNTGLGEMQVFAVPQANNLAPTANAGPDKTVDQGSQVRLDGSASSDAGHAPLTYAWKQVAGPNVTLQDPATIHPVFTSPTGLAQNAQLRFALVVNNGNRDSAPATVDISVVAPQNSVNLASKANIFASSENSRDGQRAWQAIDGVVDGYPGNARHEWVTRREKNGAWIELRWPAPVTISRVVLFDRPNLDDQITAAVLRFSDGSSVAVPALANNGAATEIPFTPRVVSSLHLTVTGTSPRTLNVGLAELQVFGTTE